MYMEKVKVSKLGHMKTKEEKLSWQDGGGGGEKWRVRVWDSFKIEINGLGRGDRQVCGTA